MGISYKPSDKNGHSIEITKESGVVQHEKIREKSSRSAYSLDSTALSLFPCEIQYLRLNGHSVYADVNT